MYALVWVSIGLLRAKGTRRLLYKQLGQRGRLPTKVWAKGTRQQPFVFYLCLETFRGGFVAWQWALLLHVGSKLGNGDDEDKVENAQFPGSSRRQQKASEKALPCRRVDTPDGRSSWCAARQCSWRRVEAFPGLTACLPPTQPVGSRQRAAWLSARAKLPTPASRSN